MLSLLILAAFCILIIFLLFTYAPITMMIITLASVAGLTGYILGIKS